MAAGRCVVATASRETALHQVVDECGVGELCPPEQLEGLVDASSKLAADRALRKSMGLAAHRYAEENLDRDAIMGRFEETLLKLAARRR